MTFDMCLFSSVHQLVNFEWSKFTSIFAPNDSLKEEEFSSFLQLLAQRITECTTAACTSMLETYFDVDTNACPSILERMRLFYDCTPKPDLGILTSKQLKAIILESGSNVSIPQAKIEETHLNAVKTAISIFPYHGDYDGVQRALSKAGFKRDTSSKTEFKVDPLEQAAKYLVRSVYVDSKCYEPTTFIYIPNRLTPSSLCDCFIIPVACNVSTPIIELQLPKATVEAVHFGRAATKNIFGNDNIPEVTPGMHSGLEDGQDVEIQLDTVSALRIIDAHCTALKVAQVLFNLQSIPEGDEIMTRNRSKVIPTLSIKRMIKATRTKG